MDFKSKTFRIWLVLSLCWLVLYAVVFLILLDDPAPVVAGYILGPPIIIILLIFAVERLKGWLRIAIISSGVWLIGWFTIGRMIYHYAMGLAVEDCALAPAINALAKIRGLDVRGTCPAWAELLRDVFEPGLQLFD